jgi:glucose/arabinose dehydrogenase
MRWLYPAFLTALLTVASCGDEVVDPPSGTDTSLVILPRNVLLALGDSIQLRAVIATSAGDTLDPLAVGFITHDPDVITVSLDGMAHATGLGGTWIVGHGANREDSVFGTVATTVALPDLQLLTNGLTAPVFLTQPPGESNRLFVVEQIGRIRILQNDVLQARPFLDIRSLVTPPPQFERGLLSMAFDPQYAANGFFYVSYTDTQGDTRIVRYSVSPDPDSADPGTASLVLGVEQPYPNHNGGLILFGRDGMLYVGLGDGGSGGDPENRAQNPDSLLGKLLRLDVRTAPYTIPPDNPFVSSGDARPEIWALGLRNPWRFSFDRETGHLYLGDVGQQEHEEVNVAPPTPGGENYGWRIMEGRFCYNAATCSTAGLTLPVLDYGHSQGACSVTGGYVYRGSAIPILSGRYLYADYCAGFIRSFHYLNGQAVDLVDWTSEIGPGFGVSSFGEDNAGELYLMSGGRNLFRIIPQSPVRITR